ncbi:MAG: amidophosphoribosyltransferase [Candidatus Kapaibacteriales bacterium]
MSNCSSCSLYQIEPGNENKRIPTPLEKSDKARPNCAVTGVYNHPQASAMVYYSLHAQQHRGQEASGITSLYFDERKKKMHYAYVKDEGLVLDVFAEKGTFRDVLRGKSAVGHNRYSTTGASSQLNIQPFNMIYDEGILALAHNGNLTNTKTLKTELQHEGAIFQTTTDSEVFLHLIARSKQDTVIGRIRETLQTVRGAYSLCIQSDEKMYAARDPHGVRPLSIGRKKNDDGTWSFMVASETCGFDIVSYEYMRSVGHNEIVVFDEESKTTGEVKSEKILDKTPESKHCISEYIYFSRPDSKIYGENVDKVRRKLGKNLAEESPMKSKDGYKMTVFAVPDSGNTATLGYARSNTKQGNDTAYEIGLIRSHYVGRTFIAPGQESREFKVKTKFNTVEGVIEDRNIVVVDDSIVRGTTSKALIKLIRGSRPKELHMMITSPPVKFPCYYGMDFPSAEELIANHYETTADIAKEIGVDTLTYISKEKMLESVPQEEGIGYCTACFTGNYPIPIELSPDTEPLSD